MCPLAYSGLDHVAIRRRHRRLDHIGHAEQQPVEPAVLQRAPEARPGRLWRRLVDAGPLEGGRVQQLGVPAALDQPHRSVGRDPVELPPRRGATLGEHRLLVAVGAHPLAGRALRGGGLDHLEQLGDRRDRARRDVRTGRGGRRGEHVHVRVDEARQEHRFRRRDPMVPFRQRARAGLGRSDRDDPSARAGDRAGQRRLVARLHRQEARLDQQRLGLGAHRLRMRHSRRQWSRGQRFGRPRDRRDHARAPGRAEPPSRERPLIARSAI